MAEVNDKISASKRVMRGISSVWSALGNKFRKRHSHRHRKKQLKWETERQMRKQKENNPEEEKKVDNKKEEEELHIYDTPKFGIEDVDQYFEEQERDLDLALEGIKNIKEQAIVMNETLVEQNERLDKLTEDGERAFLKTKEIRNTVSRLV